MVNKKYTYKIKIWAGILFAQFILFFLASKNKYFVDKILLLFFNKKKLTETLFSNIHFSFGDLFYIILLTGALITLTACFHQKLRHKAALAILIVFNVFYCSYQLTWGVLYSKEPISEKLPKTKITDEEVKKLAIHYILLTNKTRSLLPENKNGIFKIKNIDALKREIIIKQNNIPKEFQTTQTNSVVNLKQSLFSKIMNYSGILGYYNPFTGEAQYNKEIPDTYLPFTLAHESAHQLGFAREQEANFIGFLICENTSDQEIKYSAYLYTSKSLLHYIDKKDKIFAKKAFKLFSNQVKKDFKNEKNYDRISQGFISEIFRRTNDIFLKYNQQDGIISYSYFIHLLMQYHKLKE